jgi:DNA-binding IclR family transcriptional regulator
VANRLEIRQIARPYMLEISAAFHETINFGMLDGLDVLHIEKIDSPEVLRMDSPIGSRAPLYCTALGKAILANRNPEEIEAYFDAVTFHPQGKGYALDDEEFKAGLRCIAVPIFDHTKRADYAMSVSGFSLRMTYRVIEKIRDKLEDTGRRLSAHMGYTGK